MNFKDSRKKIRLKIFKNLFYKVLGCKIPTEYTKIEKGQTVLDLASGAGNNMLVARQIAGAIGYVIGVNMTEAMIDEYEVITRFI